VARFGVYRNRSTISQRLPNDESVVRCASSNVREPRDMCACMWAVVEVVPPTEHEFQWNWERLSSRLRGNCAGSKRANA